MKKKLMQATTTTLLASAALVVTSPAQTSAASNATDLVAKAKSSASLLKQYYNAEETKLTKEFLNAYDHAKANIAKAENARIKDNKLNAQLESAKNELLKAARLIDAIKVGEQLADDTETLKQYINVEELNDKMVEAYHQLSEQIRKSERVFSKVYGEKNREAIRAEFLLGAKIAKESVIYEVSRYILQDQISKQIEKDKIAEAKENYAKLNRLERRAEEIKADGNKLYPGKYPQLSKMADSLNSKKGKLRSNLTISIEAESTKQGEPTVYGTEEQQKVEKDLVVTAAEGTFLELKNLEVNGDIVIKGVNGSAGKVTLTNVNVTGTVKVDGEEDKKTLAAEGKETLKQLQLLVDKQTQIKRLSLVSRTELTAETGAKISSVNITPAIPSHLFTLNGDLSSTNVTVKGKESEVKLGATAKILELLVNSKATINAENGASLLSLLLDPTEKNTDISLKGDLSKTNVLVKNSNASVSVGAGTIVKKIEKDESVKGDIKVDNNGTVIDSDGVDVGTPSDSTYTPPVSNNGGQPEVPNEEQTETPTIETVEDIDVAVSKGEAFNLPAEVQVLLSDSTRQNVDVDWGSATVNTSTLGKFEFLGTVEGYNERVILTLTVSPEGYTVKSDGVAVVTDDESFKYALEQNDIETIEITESLTSASSRVINKKIVIPVNVDGKEIDFNNSTLSDVEVFGDNVTLKNATIGNLLVEDTVDNLYLVNILDTLNSNHTLDGGGGNSIVLSGDTTFQGNIKITSGEALQIRTDSNSNNAKIEGTVLIEAEARTKIAAPVKNVVIGKDNEDIEINSTVEQLVVRSKATIKMGEFSSIKKLTKRIGVEVTATDTKGEALNVEFVEILDNFELARILDDATDILANAQVGDAEGEYTEDAMDLLTEVKENAQAVYENNKSITIDAQNNVDQATDDLKTAINTFKKSAIRVDRSALYFEWNRAQRAANRAIIGTSIGEYPQIAHDTLIAIIEDAKEMYENFGESQADIDAKVEQLQQAIQTFVDSKIGGGDGNDILHEGKVSFFIKGEQFVTSHPFIQIIPFNNGRGSHLNTYRNTEVFMESDGVKVEVTNIDETLADTFYATIVVDGYLFIEELTKDDIKNGVPQTIEVNEEDYVPIEVALSGVNQGDVKDVDIVVHPVNSEGNATFDVSLPPGTKVPFGTYNIQYNAYTDSVSYELFKDNVTISATNNTVSFKENELALVNFEFTSSSAVNFEFEGAVGLYSLGEKYNSTLHARFADNVRSLYLTKNHYETIYQMYRFTKDGQTWQASFRRGDIDLQNNETISADDQLKVEADTNAEEITLNKPFWYYFSQVQVTDGKGNYVHDFQKLHWNQDGYYDYTQERATGKITVVANGKTFTKEVEHLNFMEYSINDIVEGEVLSGDVEIIFSVEDFPISIKPYSKTFKISTETNPTSLDQAQASTQSASTLDLYAGFDVQDGTVKIS